MYLGTKKYDEILRILGDRFSFRSTSYEDRMEIMHKIMVDYFKVNEDNLPNLRDCDLLSILFLMLGGMSLQNAIDGVFLQYVNDFEDEYSRELNNWSSEVASVYYHISNELRDDLIAEGRIVV